MLSEKHELFAQEYMKDMNATQAAIRAGYSEKTARVQGSRLLTYADIRARINELQKERAEKVSLDANWVLRNLQNVVERSMQAEPVMKWDYEEKALVETGDYTFDSAGANRALELIGKHLGMFTEKMKLDVNGEVTHSHEYHIEHQITTDPESAELLKQLYKRQAASSA